MNYDIAVVGAGIIGLAHALAAVRLGKRVIVIERDAFANGASIRNFGFVTVSGQSAGECWEMARRSRDIWEEVARAAHIPVLQRGLIVAARRPQSEAVIDAFLATDMGEGCRRIRPQEARQFVPAMRSDTITAALHSPHELRVESKTAVPQIAAWLAEQHDVAFKWSTNVRAVKAPRIETTGGVIEADAIVICSGTDYLGPYAERLATYNLMQCQLHMLRVTPDRPIIQKCAVMSDLGLARYNGYADQPAAQALKAQLDREQRAHRENGVHLIVVQSADGSLVVGDSHHYGETLQPFASAAVQELILEEMQAVLDLGNFAVRETWLGTYASAADRWYLVDAPDHATRIVVVTAGCGASTAFALGEATIADLFG